MCALSFLTPRGGSSAGTSSQNNCSITKQVSLYDANIYFNLSNTETKICFFNLRLRSYVSFPFSRCSLHWSK